MTKNLPPRLRRAMAVTLLLAACAAPALAGAQVPGSADQVFLDRLGGDWNMSGFVLGKPVRYRAHGERVLQGGFVRLQVIDEQLPPKYEAEVFLGYDAKAGDYIAHWLDRFGAAGARVVAAGRREGQRLVLVFPYVDGALRDTFTFNAEAGTWTLLVESPSPDGGFSRFASYVLVRAGADPASLGKEP